MVDPETSRAALAAGLALTRMSTDELVVRCAAIGDHITPGKLGAMLLSSAPRSELEHDVVALTLNEHLGDVGLNRPVPSSDELRAGGTVRSPGEGAARPGPAPGR